MISRRNIVVYVSGKFSNPKWQEQKINILEALKMATKLWNIGFTAICPHTNAPQTENGCTCRYEEFLEGDIELLLRSDAILMLPGWEDSVGATIELQEAKKMGKPIFYRLEELASFYPPTMLETPPTM